MENTFLEKADKQWADNGLLIEKAILLIQRAKRGEYIADEKFDDVLSGLLTTLMTDTPSGMFGSAFTSMIEGRILAGAEIHAGDGGYQETPIENYKENPAWTKRLNDSLQSS